MLGDSVQIMSTFPDSAVDFILTDPPYLGLYAGTAEISVTPVLWP